MKDWVQQVRKLAEVTISQPQASYTAFTVSLRHRWTHFVIKDTSDVTDLFEPPEYAM